MHRHWCSCFQTTILTTLAFLALGCGYPSSKGSVLRGNEYCRSIDLPHVWQLQNGTYVASSVASNFEYRRIPSRSNEWCLAHKELYSKDRSNRMLCISPTSTSLLPIDPEWPTLPEYIPRYGHDFPDESRRQFDMFVRARRPGMFQLQDVSIELAGEKWGDLPNPSTDRQYVILMSHDEDNWIVRKTTINLWAGHGHDTAHSPAYVQVIDLSSGKEVIRITYELNKYSVSNITNGVGWLDHRTFVSVDTLDEKVILCTLP